jgi:hypothetical protein
MAGISILTAGCQGLYILYTHPFQSPKIDDGFKHVIARSSWLRAWEFSCICKSPMRFEHRRKSWPLYPRFCLLWRIAYAPPPLKNAEKARAESGRTDLDFLSPRFCERRGVVVLDLRMAEAPRLCLSPGDSRVSSLVGRASCQYHGATTPHSLSTFGRINITDRWTPENVDGMKASQDPTLIAPSF